ncbi:unnamed protein product [Lactuca saligna]|uniref:Uncharacterized protein n=1 Tax=Lactuca saligna TaxID=75948 RepID=A0AA36E9S2_LACSI|nr:unnamed protein product [Lactuca saligna]
MWHTRPICILNYKKKNMKKQMLWEDTPGIINDLMINPKTIKGGTIIKEWVIKQDNHLHTNKDHHFNLRISSQDSHNIHLNKRVCLIDQEKEEEDIMVKKSSNEEENNEKSNTKKPATNKVKYSPVALFLERLVSTKKEREERTLSKTGVIIQLVDRSIVHPNGLLDDVPFLKTAKTKIDVYNGTQSMKFDKEVIGFNIFEENRYPSKNIGFNGIGILIKVKFQELEEFQNKTFKNSYIYKNKSKTFHDKCLSRSKGFKSNLGEVFYKEEGKILPLLVYSIIEELNFS